MTTQLSQLRDSLNDTLTQLNQPNPNDSAVMRQAFSVASHVVGLINTLNADPQLRAAIDQTPECQNLANVDGTSSTTSPTELPAPTS
jgi:hypothetical protein